MKLDSFVTLVILDNSKFKQLSEITINFINTSNTTTVVTLHVEDLITIIRLQITFGRLNYNEKVTNYMWKTWLLVTYLVLEDLVIMLDYI